MYIHLEQDYIPWPIPSWYIAIASWRMAANNPVEIQYHDASATVDPMLTLRWPKRSDFYAQAEATLDCTGTLAIGRPDHYGRFDSSQPHLRLKRSTTSDGKSFAVIPAARAGAIPTPPAPLKVVDERAAIVAAMARYTEQNAPPMAPAFALHMHPTQKHYPPPETAHDTGTNLQELLATHLRPNRRLIVHIPARTTMSAEASHGTPVAKHPVLRTLASMLARVRKTQGTPVAKHPVLQLEWEWLPSRQGVSISCARPYPGHNIVEVQGWEPHWYYATSFPAPKADSDDATLSEATIQEHIQAVVAYIHAHWGALVPSSNPPPAPSSHTGLAACDPQAPPPSRDDPMQKVLDQYGSGWPRAMAPRLSTWGKHRPFGDRGAPREGELLVPDLGGPHMHRHLPANTVGRDFISGDIHGDFTELEQLLEHLKFDPAKDRVIACGDLLDRGSENHRYLEFLAYEWFHSTRGNHEQILIDRDRAPSSQEWEAYDKIKQALGQTGADQAVQSSRQLPLAVTLDTAYGPVGIVHAGMPPDRTWAEFTAALVRGDRIDTALALFEYNSTPLRPPDIHALIHGHYPVHSHIDWNGHCINLDDHTGGLPRTLLEIVSPDWVPPEGIEPCFAAIHRRYRPEAEGKPPTYRTTYLLRRPETERETANDNDSLPSGITLHVAR